MDILNFVNKLSNDKKLEFINDYICGFFKEVEENSPLPFTIFRYTSSSDNKSKYITIGNLNFYSFKLLEYKENEENESIPIIKILEHFDANKEIMKEKTNECINLVVNNIEIFEKRLEEALVLLKEDSFIKKRGEIGFNLIKDKHEYDYRYEFNHFQKSEVTCKVDYLETMNIDEFGFDSSEAIYKPALKNLKKLFNNCVIDKIDYGVFNDHLYYEEWDELADHIIKNNEHKVARKMYKLGGLSKEISDKLKEYINAIDVANNLYKSGNEGMDMPEIEEAKETCDWDFL